MRRRGGTGGGKRAGQRPALAMLTLNMTPMIDCVFMLLMFFVFTVDFRPRESALVLDRPIERSAAAGAGSGGAFALPERPVVVTVRSIGDGPGEFSISTDEPVIGAPASAEALRARAEAARGTTLPQSQTFSVRSARGTRWEHTLTVFHALQRAGYREITLAAPPRAGGVS